MTKSRGINFFVLESKKKYEVKEEAATLAYLCLALTLVLPG
jgi:hypothetical protein